MLKKLKERKVSNRKEKEINRNPYFYAKNNDFLEQNNKLPVAFKNKIICANCLEVLNQLPDNCMDMIVTSPPYNFGLEYSDYNDTFNWKEYFKNLWQILDECIRVLKYSGRLAINVQPLYSDYIPIHHIISHHLIKRKLIWKTEILWEKNNYNCKFCSFGSWKSPVSPYMKYTWEFIEVFCKGDLKKNGDTDKIDISADEFKEWIIAKWSIAPEKKMQEFGHPAMFPEKLVERLLKLFSFKDDIILDPFNGAGTTTAVASRMGRNYLGIDISEKYCRIARKRIGLLCKQ